MLRQVDSLKNKSTLFRCNLHKIRCVTFKYTVLTNVYAFVISTAIKIISIIPWSLHEPTTPLPQETTVLIFPPTLLFLVAQMVKHLPAMQKTWAWSLGWEDPLLEKGMATHSLSILAWRFRGQRSLAGYSPRDLKRVGHNWANTTHTYSKYPLVSVLLLSMSKIHACVAQSGVHLFSSVQLLSCVWLFPTTWTATRQLPCRSPTPRAYSDSCPLSWWCHPNISSSIVLFSSHLQLFPGSGSFPMSQFFASGGQSIGVSASASVLPVNIQDWFPSGLTGWISLQSKGLSGVFSNTTVQMHQFFSA